MPVPDLPQVRLCWVACAKITGTRCPVAALPYHDIGFRLTGMRETFFYKINDIIKQMLTLINIIEFTIRDCHHVCILPSVILRFLDNVFVYKLMEKKCEAFFSFSFFNYLIGRNFLKFDELKHNVKPHQINMDVIKISIEDRYTKYDCTQ